MLHIDAPDTELARLGARQHEVDALRRSLGLRVQRIEVTAAGYVVRPHVGEPTTIPHGWLPDLAPAVEVPRAPRVWVAPQPFDPDEFPTTTADAAPDVPELVAVLDTETTGLHATARVIEVAVAVLDLRALRIVGAWPSKDAPGVLLNPGVPVGDSVEAHGITDEMLVGAATFPVIAASLSAFVGDLPVVAHGASFDERLVGSEYDLAGIERPRWSWFDSSAIARRVVPGLRSYSLSGRGGAPGLRQSLGLGNATAHRAWGDVLTTCALLRVLRGRAGAPWSSWCGRPMRVWGATAPARPGTRRATPAPATPSLRGIA